MTTRRRFLQLIGAAGSIALAGCASQETIEDVERGEGDPIEAAHFFKSLTFSNANTFIVGIRPDLNVRLDDATYGAADVVILEQPDGTTTHKHPIRGTEEITFSVASDDGLYTLVARADNHNDGGIHVAELVIEVSGTEATPISYDQTVYYE